MIVSLCVCVFVCEREIERGGIAKAKGTEARKGKNFKRFASQTFPTGNISLFELPSAASFPQAKQCIPYHSNVEIVALTLSRPDFEAQQVHMMSHANITKKTKILNSA